MSEEAVLEDALERLYGVPLDRFVSERNSMANEVRPRNRAAAERIHRLRKPSVAAWALNQAARAAPEEVVRLLEATQALRAAGSRGAPDDLRAGVAHRNDALARLTRLAAEELTRAGHGAGRNNLDRVRNTLLASTADPARAEDLVRGRVERDLEPSGFEVWAPPSEGGQAPPDSSESEEEAERADAEAAARALEELVAVADRAEAEAARLEEEAVLAEAEAARRRAAAEEGARAAREARRRAHEAQGRPGRTGS